MMIDYDFRKGDKVHEVGSKLKGTVLHKGNRDEVVGGAYNE